MGAIRPKIDENASCRYYQEMRFTELRIYTIVYTKLSIIVYKTVNNVIRVDLPIDLNPFAS